MKKLPDSEQINIEPCLKILIAEDDKDISEILSYDLKRFFHPRVCHIDEVTTVTNAVENLKSKQYDFIISDYYLRDLTGDKIRDISLETPFIFIGGDLPCGVSAADNTYTLEKPFLSEELHQTVVHALKVAQSESV